MTAPLPDWASVEAMWREAASSMSLRSSPSHDGLTGPMHARPRALLEAICHVLAKRAQEPHATELLVGALARRYGLDEVMGIKREQKTVSGKLWTEALRGPHHKSLHRALQATARHARHPESVLKGPRPLPLHPTGVTPLKDTQTCGECAWSFEDATHGVRCRHAHADGSLTPLIQREWPACYRYETPHTGADCMACGACCREAFHLVPVEEDEPIRQVAPEILVHDAHGTHVPRPQGKCAALSSSEGPPWLCSVYSDRPQACRSFTLDGPHCLTARQRVGLSEP